nr:meiotic cohesin complex subunit [Farysia itapuensis]
MFYNSDILSRRRTGLGVVWLAATLGNKSSVRRLSRKEVLAVNVSKACTLVRSPSEPMALRLSSQLLYGVVKIYHHQAEIWMQDVSTAHTNLRRQITALSETMTSTIDMPKPPAKHLDTITMRLDMSYFALDLDQEALLYIDAFSLRDATPVAGLIDDFRSPAPNPNRFVATEEQITLPGRFLEDEPGVGRQREDDFTIPALAEGFDEDDGYDGLDLGLDTVDGQATNLHIGPQEGLDLLPLGDRSGLGGSSSAEWPDVDHRLSLDITQMHQNQPGPLAIPARRPFPFDAEEAEIEALLGPARSRPRRVPRLEPLQDVLTELTDEELRVYRSGYVDRMAELREDRSQRHIARAADHFARSRIFGPPYLFQQGDLLSHLWDATIGARLHQVEARYRHLRTEAQNVEFRPDSSSPFAPSPFEDFGGVFDDDMGVPRAAVDQVPLELRGPRESLPWNMLMAQRRRSSLLHSASYDQATFQREGTPLQFAAEQSIDTPLGLRSQSRQHESPSVAPKFGTPSTATGFDDFPFQAPGTPSVEGLRLNLPAHAFTVEDAPAAPSRFDALTNQAHDEDIRQETRNFLEYSLSVQNDLADPRGFLFFSDLAPVASSNPEVAAQAFYHTLALASSGAFKVKQSQAYQEIQIAITT